MTTSDILPAPIWEPDVHTKRTANLSGWLSSLGFSDVQSFHTWTVTHYPAYWQRVIDTLLIPFDKKPDAICDLSKGIRAPSWLPGATFNIANSCFLAASSDVAVIDYHANNKVMRYTYDALHRLSNRIANSLVKKKFQKGDAFAIIMPMHYEAVAIYLGIIKMGGVVVSIADSFSKEEIAMRLQIADAKAIFTQDVSVWMGKEIALYEKIKLTGQIPVIVLSQADDAAPHLRPVDFAWDHFLVKEENFTSVACQPQDVCNILFSSGTTASPKAIPWYHTTPIKAAADALLHHNIQAGDVLAWPTNLGWMMGPWLIFAALINRATIALYTEAPKTRAFGEFVRDVRVTMLGVVPTLVAHWRETNCMTGLDWSSIKVFSSTGECSHPDDMRYLSSLAGGKPIIEYCGGTEIGGAYLSSTVLDVNYPSLFSTPTMGLDIVMLNEEGKLSTEGEVAILPPSMGLSTSLLNADHDAVYYTGMPETPDGKLLRRHGDQVKQLSNGYYCVLGRVDDAMNLGGIKISAAEVERILMEIPHIIEVAAVAVPLQGSHLNTLVIYAVAMEPLNRDEVKQAMQMRISQHLNPLFKIHDVILVEALPKTASNKIMRRLLRQGKLSIFSAAGQNK